MRRKHNDDRYFKSELESESERQRESEIASRRVASKARSERSEREREREDPIARQHRSERDDRDGHTRRRENGERFAEASGLRSSRKSFLSGRRCTERELRVTPAGQQHARRDRGQHQHRTRYCVVCSCCEQPLHQELINLRGYRWL